LYQEGITPEYCITEKFPRLVLVITLTSAQQHTAVQLPAELDADSYLLATSFPLDPNWHEHSRRKLFLERHHIEGHERNGYLTSQGLA
jgi:hypothetical protein